MSSDSSEANLVRMLLYSRQTSANDFIVAIFEIVLEESALEIKCIMIIE